MTLWGRGRRAIPRLTPELDDQELGSVCRQLRNLPMTPGIINNQIDLAARLFEGVDGDWDRLGHRMAVLADEFPDPAFARSWVLRHAESADARIFRARVAYVRLRSDSSAIEEAYSAINDCSRAASLRRDDPTPWVTRMGLCRLLNRHERDVFSAWQEVVSRDSWNREGDLQMLSYLMGTDDGSYWRVGDFIDYRCAAMPPDAPSVGLELAATLGQYMRSIARPGVEGLLADRWWREPRQADLLDRAVKMWVSNGALTHAGALADLNGLAYALFQSKRWAEAGETFLQIGSVVAPWPWAVGGDPLREFASCRKQAMRFVAR